MPLRGDAAAKRRKKGSAIATALAVALAAIGIGVLLYPSLSDLWTRHLVREEIEQYNRVLEAEPADYTELWEAADEYNQEVAVRANHLTSDESLQDSAYGLLNPNDSNMLGYVEIPSIDIELPIYRGTEDRQLQSGAGWWIGSSLPTGEPGTHCVIAGHTGLAKAKLFTDLDQLEEGDLFAITVLDRKVTYKVDQILVTEPADVAPLAIDPGESYATLYTCTPYGVNDHRLLVRGTCVSVGPASTSQDRLAGEAPFSETWAPVAAIALIPIAAGTMFVAARRYAGSRRKSMRSIRRNG